MPALRPTGTLHATAGYDPQTGLLRYQGCVVPPIADPPTLDDAQAAVRVLRDVVCDFPFAAAAHHGAWLASVLTGLCRSAFDGPAPLVLFDANTRGSGKSLLADVVGLIVTGRPMAWFSAPSDDDEMRKRITAIALAGDPLVLLDNLDTALGSASLDAALTGTVWRDRFLGKNQCVKLPLSATWVATGNNVQLRADTSLRHGESATCGWSRRMSARKIGAGRLDMDLRPWGSFEG